MARQDDDLDDFGRFAEPALMILISLADGEKHGYAMTDDIEQIAGVRFGPGTLYGAITRLEGRGLIQRMESDDRRNPYRLTALGEKALRARLASLQAIARDRPAEAGERMTWLLRLYPSPWRRRYGGEVAEMLAHRGFSLRIAVDLDRRRDRRLAAPVRNPGRGRRGGTRNPKGRRRC